MKPKISLDEWSMHPDESRACLIEDFHDSIYVLDLEGYPYVCINAKTKVVFEASYADLVRDNGADFLVQPLDIEELRVKRNPANVASKTD